MRKPSFSAFINNMSPSFLTNDPETDAEIPRACQDSIFLLQTKHTTSFDALSVGAFAIVGIIKASDVSFSKKIYAKLQDIQVLRSDGTIDTKMILGTFNRAVVFLSIPAQRRLIGLLFFWESEVERRRHFLDVLRRGDMVEDAVLRAEVEREMIRLPSERTQTDSIPAYEAPPAY